MKKGINYWCFPKGLTGEESIVAAMETAKAMGFDAIELSVFETGALALDTSPGAIKQIANAAQDIGIEICSLATLLHWEYSLTSDNATVRQKGKEILRRMLEIAALLGTDCILVVPGAVDVFFDPRIPMVAYDVAYKRALDAIGEALPEAEKYGVCMALENVWNKFLLSPLEMRAFVDSFQSPLVAAYFDVGNVLLTGYPESWIRILGQRIRRVHVKDFRREVGNVHGFVNLLEGDVNWPEVMDALRAIAYDNAIIAEIIPPYKHYTLVMLEHISRAMDNLLGRDQ